MQSSEGTYKTKYSAGGKTERPPCLIKKLKRTYCCGTVYSLWLSHVSMQAVCGMWMTVRTKQRDARDDLCEQASLVKTVKVSRPIAKLARDPAIGSQLGG